jgi:hypothetical protein
MLAWALWLAFSLIKWLGWGWTCFAEGGMWRRKMHYPDDQQKADYQKEQAATSPAPPEEQFVQSKEPELATVAETPKSRIKSWYLRFRKTSGHTAKTGKK